MRASHQKWLMDDAEGGVLAVVDDDGITLNFQRRDQASAARHFPDKAQRFDSRHAVEGLSGAILSVNFRTACLGAQPYPKPCRRWANKRVVPDHQVIRPDTGSVGDSGREDMATPRLLRVTPMLLACQSLPRRPGHQRKK